MLKIVCIPAYNEENTISDIVIRSLKYADKVIVYDDGSTDLTSEKAKNSGAIVIRHEKNIGKGKALRSLFDHLKKLDFDVAVTIDGDGQFLPEEIEILSEPILKNNFDLVIGNRFSNSEEMPRYRKTGNKILDKITKLASDLPVEDSQSGFRAYSPKAINLLSVHTSGFGVDSEILVDAVKKNLKITEQPVTVLYDTGFKTSTQNPISHSTGVLSSLLQLIAINHPLRYLGIPGFILLIIGTFFSIIVITMFNEDRFFSIPSTLVAIGSLVTGLMLLLMSVVLFSLSQIVKKLND
jgi:glycosyltransferase involved in cell wall biosynthesis